MKQLRLTTRIFGATLAGVGALLCLAMPVSAQVFFSSDVQPIFTESCVNRGCHPGGGAPFSLQEGVSYTNLVNAPVAVPDCGADFRVVPFDSDNSMLYLRIAGRTPCVRMPLIGDTLSTAEQNTIRDWIDEGTLNDVITCDAIFFFNAKCNANGAAQGMVKITGDWTGSTVTFDLDGDNYVATVLSNGTNSIAKMQIPAAGFGSHTVTLEDPAGCYSPVMFNCQVDRQTAQSDEFDRLWAETELWNTAPAATDLHGNYPNPFNPTTTIRYSLAKETRVTLKVYSMLGEEVMTIVDEVQTAGEKSATWNGRTASGSQVSAGVYIYTLATDDFVQTAKMVILK